MIKVQIHLLNESVIHPFMDACDLTDKGMKIFCEASNGKPNLLKLSYNVTPEQFDLSVSTLLNSKVIKPVFALVKASDGFVGVYWRQNINQISTGHYWLLYHKFVKLMLAGFNPTIVLSRNVTVESITLLVSGQELVINNLNNNIY